MCMDEEERPVINCPRQYKKHELLENYFFYIQKFEDQPRRMSPTAFSCDKNSLLCFQFKFSLILYEISFLVIIARK